MNMFMLLVNMVVKPETLMNASGIPPYSSGSISKLAARHHIQMASNGFRDVPCHLVPQESRSRRQFQG